MGMGGKDKLDNNMGNIRESVAYTRDSVQVGTDEQSAGAQEVTGITLSSG